MANFSSTGRGAVLLGLVSRGHALIAELLRLSKHVPSAFYDARYAPLLFDFKYLKSPDLHEERIETSTELLILDDEFREKFSHVLHRFYILFHGITRFYQDLLQYLEDLQEGAYTQSSVQSVLENEEGCQLIVEALVLHGILILLLEHRLEGDLREKLVIAYSRCKGTLELPNFEIICTLCRALPPQQQSAFSSISSFAPFFQSTLVPCVSTMLTTTRPEELFARLPLPKAVVSTVIGKLRADDIYHQICHYPNPEHRWVALNSQAGFIFVLLYHFPDVLQNDTSTMQEIVEKFFKANWVIPIYMGFSVDLVFAWDKHKAAKSCLGSIIAISNLKPLVNKFTAKVKNMIAELDNFLCEGLLTHDYVLRNIQALVSCLRDCNVALRWLLLHRNTVNRKLKDLVISIGDTQGVNEGTLFSLLLDASRLEYELKHIYGDLMNNKESRWNQCRQQAADCVQELANFFSGSQISSGRVKDEGLQYWLAQMVSQVSSLDCNEDSKTGRKVQHIISALSEVEQSHQIEGSLQTKQHFIQTQCHLEEMLQSLSAHESTLATISVVSDAAYAWDTIGVFTKHVHLCIQSDPSTVSNLECLFLKLRSIMDIPLRRILQYGSEDIVSVSEYYSSELITYIHRVLEIIPVCIFTILKEVVAKQSQELYDVPVRVEKELLRDFAQLEDRYILAKATHQVSILSQGIMAMAKTFVGTFELDPKQLIEDGIRKQLADDLGHVLQSIFVFSSGRIDELEEKLQKAHDYTEAQQRLMEYFQDYVHIHGLRLWQEEILKSISWSVEQECRQYVKKKGESAEKSKRGHSMQAAQLHVSGQKHNQSTSFMGSIIQQLLLMSDPARTMYLAPMSGWFSAGGQELLGLHTFTILNESLGAAGMLGVDQILSFKAASSLQECMIFLQNQHLFDPSLASKLEVLEGVLTPLTAVPNNGLLIYKELSLKSMDWEEWVGKIAHIGCIQLLRCLISSQLRGASKVESSLMSHALDGINTAFLVEMHKHDKTDVGHKQADIKSLHNDLFQKLQACGLQTPLQTIYITSNVPAYFSLMIFMVTMSQLPRYVLDNHLGTLVSRKKRASLDFCPLILGIVTLFRQFHPKYMAIYTQYLGQYVRTRMEAMSMVNEPSTNAPADHHAEVRKILTWIFALQRFSNLSINVTEAPLPLAAFTTLVK